MAESVVIGATNGCQQVRKYRELTGPFRRCRPAVVDISRSHIVESVEWRIEVLCTYVIILSISVAKCDGSAPPYCSWKEEILV
jgi:hypothetical protein